MLYTFCRSAANIWDVHELNLARLGKELLDKLDEVKQQNDANNQVIVRSHSLTSYNIVQYVLRGSPASNTVNIGRQNRWWMSKRLAKKELG